MIKRLVLIFKLAWHGVSLDILAIKLEESYRQLEDAKQENARLLAVLENIAAVHPVGGQRRLLAKAALPKGLQPPI
jgi:hypothetical protein